MPMKKICALLCAALLSLLLTLPVAAEGETTSLLAEDAPALTAPGGLRCEPGHQHRGI